MVGRWVDTNRCGGVFSDWQEDRQEDAALHLGGNKPMDRSRWCQVCPSPDECDVPLCWQAYRGFRQQKSIYSGRFQDPWDCLARQYLWSDCQRLEQDLTGYCLYQGSSVVCGRCPRQGAPIDYWRKSRDCLWPKCSPQWVWHSQRNFLEPGWSAPGLLSYGPVYGDRLSSGGHLPS